MKKTIKILVSACAFMLLFFAMSCSNNDVDPLFDQTINERTDALKTEYLNVLTVPENGWIGYYSPNKNFGAYTMLLDFEEDGGVSIKSDYQSDEDDITYRLDKTLKIELVFESASVFSDIFALNNNNNNGEFVFNILSATNEEIILESKLDYGDDVTIFKLHPATESDLDLDNIMTSVENISGDGNQSVFRNVLYNDEVIATFDFNASTRLTTVSYIKDGETQSVSGPIAITADGFYFITPVDINGVILTSFVYNETTNEYENTSENLRIIYDNIPGLPLPTHTFAGASLRYNYIDYGRSSTAFDNLLNQVTENIATTRNRYLSRVYIRNILPSATGAPYVDIWYQNSSGTTYYMYFYITYEFRDDKVFFELTGETNSNAASYKTEMQPLLDAIVGSSSGYYIKDTGKLTGSSNTTVTLINADDPKYAIDYYEF